MRMNQRGELTTLTVLAIAAGYSVAIALVPMLNPVTMIQRITGQGAAPTAESAAGQHATWTRQTEVREPVLLVPPAGAPAGTPAAVGVKETLSYDTGTEKKDQVLTYSQRVSKFFAGLTTWGLVLVVGGGAFLFFVLGITPGMIWRRGKRRAEEVAEKERLDKQKFESALTSTVSALRGVPPDVWAQISPLLAAAQDKADKRTIDEIKAGLHS